MAATQSAGTSFGLLLLRLPLGAIFIVHGLAKVIGENAPGVDGFSKNLTNIGVPLPFPSAVAAIGAGIVGGAIVVLGLGFLSRLGALALAVTMVVGIVCVHFQHGFFIPLEVAEAGRVNWGYEYPLALLGMSLCVVFAGPGRLGLWSGGGGSHGGSD